MKSKRSTLLIAVSLGMAAVMVACLVFGLIFTDSNTQPMQTYTVYDDGEYYSETTYYYNEDEYLASVNSGLQTNAPKARATVASVTNVESNSNPSEEFVMAAVKNVWVEETQNDDGIVTESRLLHKAEVEQVESLASVGYDSILLSSAGESVLIAEERQSKHKLSLEFVVTEKDNIYTVKSYVGWQAKLVFSWEKETSAEEYYDDYLGHSWGGEGLNALEFQMSGIYHNNDSVSCSTKDSDKTCGVIWQFREKSGYMGSELKEACAITTIEKPTQLKGKKTSLKMTYIHTYHYFDADVEIDTSDIGLKVSNSKDNWQVQMDCLIEY